MSRMQLKDLNHRHEGIAHWLMANPDKNMGDCARALGYTQAWLSQVIHTDAFQAYYQRLLEDYVDDRVRPLRDKINNIAHKACGALEDQLDTPEFIPPKDLASIADRALQRLGYGGGSANGASNPQSLTQINNYYSVDQDTLARARARFNAQWGDGANAAPTPAPAELEHKNGIESQPAASGGVGGRFAPGRESRVAGEDGPGRDWYGGGSEASAEGGVGCAWPPDGRGALAPAETGLPTGGAGRQRPDAFWPAALPAEATAAAPRGQGPGDAV